MSNKFVAMLIPVSKIWRFQLHPNDEGMVNLGYLVKLSSCADLDQSLLRYYAFRSLLDESHKIKDNIEDVFIEYLTGSSELCGNKGFEIQYKSLSNDIDLLTVPRFYKVLAGFGFWFFLASITLCFLKWWLIFIVPPIVWFIASWAKNMLQLNYAANLAILSHRSNSFKIFCIENGLVTEFPKDLSEFKIIGNAFGGDEEIKLGRNNSWSDDLVNDIQNGVSRQSLALSMVDIQMK